LSVVLEREHPHQGWIAVLAGAALIGCAALYVFTFGVFLKPLTQEFGWTRSSVAGAVTVHLVLCMIMAPIVGGFIDRHSPARAMSIACVLYGGIFAALGLMRGSLIELYALFAAGAVLGCGAALAPVVVTRIVAGWFVRRRGLALGLTLCGAGIGVAVLPTLAGAAISAFGWRTAHMVLGGGVALLGLVSAAMLRKAPSDPSKSTASAEGLPFERALLTSAFWILIATYLVVGVCYTGLVVHLVPLLTDRGVDADAVAIAQGLLGLSVIVGRAGSALVIDRLWAPGLAAAFLLFAALSGHLFVSTQDDSSRMVAAVLLGLAGGAEVNIMAYLVARYFGLRAYGKIYAWPYGIYMLGAAFGPLIAGLLFDLNGSYDGVAPALSVGFLVAAAMFLIMRRPASRSSSNLTT
jgi:MFS family permease